MRVAVVFIGVKYREKLIGLAKSLQKGLQAQGHQVDLVDGSKDVNTKLTGHEYIAVGSESISFGGKIPDKVSEYLGIAGMISGKRSYAFIVKKGFGTEKALDRLMKAMEAEGMYIKNSDIITSPEEAEVLGKRLHVTK